MTESGAVEETEVGISTGASVLGVSPASTIVVKIGTSSITDERGEIVPKSIEKLCAEVAGLRGKGHHVAVVTSGAIAAGLPVVGINPRPTDPAVLQAVSAVGQSRLLAHYDRALASHGLVGGQILLAPLDFVNRSQYLQARQTLEVLLSLGVVPIINENDAVADDEIRFGDNDRLASLVSNLLGAELLVLLTDAPGLLTADPRLDREASLIEEITEFDHDVESLAGGSGTERGSGGMASKVAAAKIASWSGVRTVIAAASRPDVLADAVEGVSGVGTIVRARSQRLSARKVWIAFALRAQGTIIVDDGARAALENRGASLLPAGVVEVIGSFNPDDAVEIALSDGKVFAKGLVRHSSQRVQQWAGMHTSSLGEEHRHEVVHADDLVLVP